MAALAGRCSTNNYGAVQARMSTGMEEGNKNEGEYGVSYKCLVKLSGITRAVMKTTQLDSKGLWVAM